MDSTRSFTINNHRCPIYFRYPCVVKSTILRIRLNYFMVDGTDEEMEMGNGNGVRLLEMGSDFYISTFFRFRYRKDIEGCRVCCWCFIVDRETLGAENYFVTRSCVNQGRTCAAY